MPKNAVDTIATLMGTSMKLGRTSTEMQPTYAMIAKSSIAAKACEWGAWAAFVAQ